MHPSRKSHAPYGQGTLLLLGLFGYGHFPVYARNMALWALSRGLKVVYVCLDPSGNAFAQQFAAHPGVRLCSLSELGFPECSAQGVDERRIQRLYAERWQSILEAAAKRFSPSHAVLLHADILFFEADSCCQPSLSLPCPTWAVATFAHREVHTGLQEPYALRLNALLRQQQGFAGVLSIDEQHVRALDPDERYLHLLPDPYQEFDAPKERDVSGGTEVSEACDVTEGSDISAVAAATPQEQADLDALRAFLERDARPVLPMLGKFDRRKNNLWILRAAESAPDLRVVVLGQRVPDAETGAQTDAQVDALLASLERQGRLFARFGYVAQGLFHATLRSPRTACLPLPYRNHYGSSGVQLMGAEHGLPVLVPEIGLMAWRVARQHLGRVFALGDYDDFAAQLGLLAREGRGPYAADCARFMTHFGPQAVWTAMDRALLGQDLPPSPLLAQDAAEDPVDRALLDGDPARALALQDAPPAGASLARALRRDVLRRGVLRWRTGDIPGAAEDFRHCRGAGLDDELHFLRNQMEGAACLKSFGGQPREAVEEMESWLAAQLLPEGEAAAPSGLAFVNQLAGLSSTRELGAESWERRGGMYVRAGALEAGEACFRVALRLAPAEHGLWLTLSDVLRYQGKSDAALAALDALEACSPGHEGLAHKRGQVLVQLGRLREAEALLRAEPEGSAYREAAQQLLGTVLEQIEGVGS